MAHIVLGITGSIAAYKACNLVRLFVKQGHEVQAVMTPAAKEFITPLTLSTLTQKPVVSEFFDRRDGSWHSHVALGEWADAFVVAPATASTIGKMAHGIADNMLLTTYLSMKAPTFIAPAMDLDMYAHPATQENLDILRKRGVGIIEPQSGELASGLVGKGRMEEPERICACVLESLAAQNGRLKGKRVLITAGPTRERLDPVRYVSNFSTGKMGFALAEACVAEGAEVELVCGPVALQTASLRIHRTDVESAADMYAAATQFFPHCDAGILCAAVADFTMAEQSAEKMKRTGDGLTLSLSATKDIAAELGRLKSKKQVLVGFALETDHEAENARKKLEKKNLDFIVLNSLRDKGAGFAYDTNKITIISADKDKHFELKSKREVAADIIDCLCERLDKSSH